MSKDFSKWSMLKVEKPWKGKKSPSYPGSKLRMVKPVQLFKKGHLAQTVSISYFPFFGRYACHNLTTSFH